LVLSDEGVKMLQRRTLGRTGLRVSLIGFGGIPIMRVTPDEAIETIGEAIERGIDFIDTARTYGDSETKIGEALRVHGKGVIVASKSPKRDRDGMLEDFDKSLSELGLDSIDLYQLHCVNRDGDFEKVLAPGGAYEALEELRLQGRLRHIGITSHNLEILMRSVTSGRFETIQVLYSFVEPDASESLIPRALEEQVGVIAMKPFAGGCIEQCDIALRYVLATPGVVAIPGMATPEEVRLNVETAENLRDITPAELSMISSIRRDIGRSYCRRCDYCQPCPNEIPIAFVLHVPSIRKRVGDEMMKTDAYRKLLDRISTCDECGECETRCPFDLPVRDLIGESRDVLRDLLG
jgi:predicted aldo/keto reductase-like oxidoreductase